MLSWPSFLNKLCGLVLDAWTVEINQFLFCEELLCMCAGCCNVTRESIPTRVESYLSLIEGG